MSNGVFPAASWRLHISSSFPRDVAFSINDLTTSTLPPSHAAKKGVAPLLVILNKSVFCGERKGGAAAEEGRRASRAGEVAAKREWSRKMIGCARWLAQLIKNEN